jgi:uncharacterized protein YkwD
VHPGLRHLPALAVVLAFVVPAVAFATDGPHVAPADRLESAVLDELNLVRLEHGLRQLRMSPSLTEAADHHSLAMVKAGYFAHESPDGSHFARRIKSFYKPGAVGRKWTVGENLIWRAERLTARTAVAAWLASPGHRENLLGPFREVGISAVRAVGAPGVYGHLRVVVLTVDFGVR